MPTGPSIARIGALLGNPARANMITTLMGGQALTASELAGVADLSAATASGHLRQLLDGGLLAVVSQGRHRYYRLAGPEVAATIESLMNFAEQSVQRPMRPGPRDPEMRKARVCYDHLAGESAVALFARLTRRNLIVLDDGGVDLTGQGEHEFMAFGIDVAALRKDKRPVCRTCLDWSERRTHLAGALGAQLLSQVFERGWARRISGTRIVRFTPHGEGQFGKLFE